MRTLHVLRHWLSASGVAMSAASAALFAILYGVELMGFASGPYVGILAFVILPAAFAIGLLLIPAGLWRDRVKRRRAAERGAPLPEYPVLDFNLASVRNGALAVAGAVGTAAVILSVGTYKGIEM